MTDDSDAVRPSGASPRRRLTPEDRRAELLDFGTQLFGERHYDDVRMDEVAEQAGVSRALLYRYFPRQARVLHGSHAGRVRQAL